MTPQQYLEWLNSEIRVVEMGWPLDEDPLYTQSKISYKAALIFAKEKFLTIEYPQQETEPKEFTDGLE